MNAVFQVYVQVRLSREGSDALKEKKNSSSHLMHLQVGVRGPHLGIQGISSVVFQTATLLQVGLELLSAPPEEKGKKKG